MALARGFLNQSRNGAMEGTGGSGHLCTSAVGKHLRGMDESFVIRDLRRGFFCVVWTSDDVEAPGLKRAAVQVVHTDES